MSDLSGLVENISFPIIGDDRGNLIAIEQMKDVPFDIKRIYYLYGTVENMRRGYHAHYHLSQVLIPVSGHCTVMTHDESGKRTHVLNKPSEGLFIKNLVWREMYEFSDDCVLVVLASELYDEDDYIRDYSEFLKILESNNAEEV